MAIIKNRRVIAVAQETTPGTAVSLTSTNAMFCFDPIMQLDIPFDDRAATGTLGNLEKEPGPRSAKLTFSLELAGSGSGTTIEPAWAAILLPACGWTGTTHVYSPTSNPGSFKTLTIAVYETGPTNAVIKKMVGAMGTFSFSAENGKRVMINFEFTGVWVPAVDGTMLTLPTFPPLPPRFAGATFTLTPSGGSAFTPKITKFSLDVGNTIALVGDITQASGYAYAVVTERMMKGKIDPMAEQIAASDVWGQLIAPTTSAMALSIGSVAGNTVAIAAPAFQFTNAQEADRDKLVTTDLDYFLAVVAGDDEASITWS